MPCDSLRERCAYDWPLAQGGEVPILARAERDGSVRPLAPPRRCGHRDVHGVLEHLSAIR